VFTVPDKSDVEHAGAEGVLGGVAGVVAPVVGGAPEAAEDAEETDEAAVDAWLPAALLLLLVDPQAAARAPVHSKAAAVLMRRAAWADDLIGGSLVWRGWRGGALSGGAGAAGPLAGPRVS
jgi:hypothetical protein